ncbi:MAG: 2-C-methyl-D-erythritol 2,4-cyclodiphosphate synthase [Candidatus Aquicultor primus]|uniref:2-C-methyl-D-erythritol 2,4-cyclodiphosphate synthase n=1 Tax=Candidatus Aquicultor primus TaxID=1797195 RepID=A0A1F2ULV4_9ACTN|nr:MAG: 2-C-methyl-D-erythritol 2,4-cyclodiphosphate synthase [Candidatus Aquicultor primus]HCG98307.1 2-C-methyl-D-erythritol 2,4-cyclodiphosphate synthase [Actinomycetota bacterium]
MRVGTGFDVHRFVRGRPLVLGGVEVPFEFGLEGHSDADVLTHAIIDAMFGATAAGDLGRYFPDTDSKFKGISSIALLRDAVRILDEQGFRLVNIDVTVILEHPKLAPFREQMREVLSTAAGLEVSRVSVKATTTEGLGFTGRGEGVAAQAVVLVEEHPLHEERF